MAAEFDRFVQRVRAERGRFFDRDRSITLVRAPGWVDLSGGIVAEASIQTLLWPTGGGVLVALQPDPEPIIRIRTGQRTDSIPCTALFLPSGPREYADAVNEIDRHCPPRSPWWGPALMAWVALMREEFVRFGGGARILLQPQASPGGAATVIAAFAQALVSAYQVHLAPRELAITCAEGLRQIDSRNFDLIGTLTTVCAPANEVMVVQPHTAAIGGSVHLPPGCAIWTLRVGEVSRQLPSRLRATLALLDQLIGEEGIVHSEPGTRLAALKLTDFVRDGRERLLAALTARPDMIGEQHAGSSLPALAGFALAEQQRTRLILALLRAATNRTQREDDLRLIGELLTQSHWEQAALGLTDPHADALAARMSSPVVFGVRQPVAASQATLVVFARSDAEADIRRIAMEYEAMAGAPVTVIGGSLAGASIGGVRSG
ncbi:hypothetical protein [Chloroflexus aurantiacus]|nr:MAG: hypothetical protein D6716_13355 [Chloroflexota bacterium]